MSARTTSTSPSDEATHDGPDRVRAIVQHAYGGPEVLSLSTVERPTPGPGQVLVAVAAAGVDRGVWHVVTGRPLLVRLAGFGVRKPKQTVPGFDVAGTIVEVGEGVTRFRPGDEVFGIAAGAYAELALAEAEKLAHRPATVTPAQAAATAVSGGTALQALTDVGGLRAGQRVLVIGASGGVGSHAVQLAVALGGVVTGVASTAKLDLVRSLGAQHVIDYTSEDLDAEGVAYDLVVDTGGLTPVRRLRRLLTPTGTLVIVGGEGGGSITGGVGRQLRALLWSPFVRQRLTTFVAREHNDVIDRLAEHLATGAVVPAIDREVSLAEVPDALRALEAGSVRGKLVVRLGTTARPD